MPLNWRLRPPELAAILEDAGAPLLIAGAGYTAVAVELARAVRRSCGSSWSATGTSVARVASAGGPRRSWRIGRHRGPDVHVRDHRRPEGRAHDPSQPRRGRRDLAALGVRRGHGQPHAAPDVPHRRHRLGVPRALERRHHDPRQRVRPGRRRRAARTPARDQRGLRADDAADDGRGAGGGGARLRGAAVDRLRGVADHHPGGGVDDPQLAPTGAGAPQSAAGARAGRRGRGPRDRAGRRRRSSR